MKDYKEFSKKEYLSLIKKYLSYVGLQSDLILYPFETMNKEQLHSVLGLVALVKTETEKGE